MKIAIAAILALSALSVAVAVTVTAYSDSTCTTLAANPVLGLANPSTVALNACGKSYTVSGTTYYVKFATCSATAVASVSYSDAACTVQSSVGAGAPDACIASPSLASFGVGSYKVACSYAATASLALVSVVAAALAVCL